jgi:hypothetical protein
MIAEALQYLIGLGKPEIVREDGQVYSNVKLFPVTPEEPKTLVVHTLTGLVDFVKECGGKVVDDAKEFDPIVHIDDFNIVNLRSALLPKHGRRLNFIRAEAIPMFGDERHLLGCPVRDMIVRLGTSFAPNDDRSMLLKLLGNISDNSSVKTLDDGITQQVEVKLGISLKGVAQIPNTVDLLPWRSFPEIEPQPSKWLIRIDRIENKGPLVSLYEVNREQWRSATIAAIGGYLRKALEHEDVVVIA